MPRFFDRPILQTTLLADGAFSLVAAAALVMLAAPLSSLTGDGITPLTFEVIGAGLFAWGIFHVAIGRQQQPPENAVRLSIAGDALWIAASIVLLVFHDGLSLAGIALVAIAMIGVADFMFFKIKGFSRHRQMA